MMIDGIKRKHSDKVPAKSITVDLNATHIAAVHVLVNDCLRMKLRLRCYEMEHEIVVPCWPTVAE